MFTPTMCREGNHIRVAQINAQRSVMVLGELRKLIEELNLDIICIQEPYSSKGRIPHMPITARIIKDGEAPMAAIVVINKLLKVVRVSQYCDTHTNCVEIVAPYGRWILVNVYFQFGEVLDLSIVRAVSGVYSDVPLIIMADANAKSPWWHSKIRDSRGEEIEEFVAQFGLNIENKPHNPFTYQNRAGACSNIDITFSNNLASETIMNWRVGQGLTTSDHNVISFDILRGGDGRDQPLLRWGYNLSRAKWEKLRLILVLPTEVVVGDNVDKKTKELTVAIKAAMNHSIPKVKTRTCDMYKPWSDALQKLRSNVRRTRCIYQKTRVEADRQRRLHEYRELKIKYKELLAETRLNSWQNFVEKNMAIDAWGTPYRLTTNKIRKPDLLSTLIREDGSATLGWRDSVGYLLNGLLPSDNVNDETDEQQIMRRQMTDVTDLGGVVYPFAVEEVYYAILKLKKKKAPGPDAIKSEVLHNLAAEVSPYLRDLFNECLVQGRIPECFKEANMVVLSKGEDKNPQLLKSYRPICLLNNLGKIQERLLCGRLREHRNLRGMNQNQFGFRKGKSTQDAINYALGIVRNSNCKYVIGIFIDISGAFDNLWWPYLFSCLRRMECPRSLYLSLLDYCKNRVVRINDWQKNISKIISKGCPQGSILGPEFWDITMEPLLYKLEELDCVKTSIAYADDLLVLIEGDSRVQLEQRSREALVAINSWCSTAKLQVAAAKTTYMFLKGTLGRDPILKIGDVRIARSKTTKYLGLHMDEKLGFRAHVEMVRIKGEKIMMKIAAIGQRRFYLPLNILQLYHNTILSSIVGYGAGVWAHRVLDRRIIRQLRSMQRRVLLRFVGAFGTTPTLALLVVLGIWPIDLQVRLRGALYWLNKTNYEMVSRIVRINARSKLEIKQALLNEWQNEWDTVPQGRRAHGVFPSVRHRLRLWHLRPGPGMVHFLTGHGPYGTYFKKINSYENDNCELCNVGDTPEHAVFECPRSWGLEVDARARLAGHTIGEILVDEGKSKDFNSLTCSFSRAARLDAPVVRGRRQRLDIQDEPIRRSQRLLVRNN